ncbi:hypothetical protein FRB98_002907 [Tulasnella sp. 332]|nr:hypothetical protein FRB98_002907 [Tulasnella sp. 332]
MRRKATLTNCSVNSGEDPQKVVQRHIKLLHEYNETKDMAQVIIGRFAPPATGPTTHTHFVHSESETGMGDIDINVAHLLGWAIGMAFYGLYVGLFAITMWVLRNHQHNRGFVFWGIVGLFIISTTQICISSAESYDAWIKNAGYPGGSGNWFIADSNPWQPVKDTFVYLGTVFADSLVCWRVYVVWSHNKWVLIAPILLLAASTVSGALVVFFESRTVEVNADTYLNTSNNLTIIVIVCTLLTNLITTSLIAGRLWWINRQVRAVASRRSSRYRKVIAAMIESGSLYTITMLILIILFGAGMINGVYLAAYIVPMVIGIFPTLIVLVSSLPSPYSDSDGFRAYDGMLVMQQVNITPKIGLETTAGPSNNSNIESGFRSNPSGGGSKTRFDDKSVVQIHVDVDQADKSDPAAITLRKGVRKQKKSQHSLANSSVPERRNMARKRASSLDLSLDSDDKEDDDLKDEIRRLSSDEYQTPELRSGTQRVEKPGTYVSVLGQKTSDDVEMANLRSPRSAL